MVSVDVPLPVTEEGLKFDVAPAGKPLTLKLTFPVNTFTAEIVVV